MRIWIDTLIVIGLLVQAVRLTAGYVLVDGGHPANWIQQTMTLVGLPSAFVIVGSAVILARRRPKDLLMRLGFAVLVGIGTVLVATAHLSLLHGLPLKAILAPDFLLRKSPSVALALASALAVNASILLLALVSCNDEVGTGAETHVSGLEREIQAELTRLQVERSAERNKLEEEQASVPVVCEYCGWRTTKPNFSRAQQALRGHWAHCPKKSHRGLHVNRG